MTQEAAAYKSSGLLQNAPDFKWNVRPRRERSSSLVFIYILSAQISPQKRQTWRLHALFAPVRTLQGIKSRRPARHRHLWLERENWEWALCAAGDRQRADGAPRIMSRTCAATDSQNWVSPSRLIIVVQNLLSSTYKMQLANIYLVYSKGSTI